MYLFIYFYKHYFFILFLEEKISWLLLFANIVIQLLLVLYFINKALSGFNLFINLIIHLFVYFCIY